MSATIKNLPQNEGIDGFTPNTAVFRRVENGVSTLVIDPQECGGGTSVVVRRHRTPQRRASPRFPLTA